jgi:hypothetical protein
MLEDPEYLGRRYPEFICEEERATTVKPAPTETESLFRVFEGGLIENAIASALSMSSVDPLGLRQTERLEACVFGIDDGVAEDERRDERFSNQGSCFSELTVREVALKPNFPEWVIRAPAIEQAIRRFYFNQGCAPTDIEIAEEMRVDLPFYWEMLTHLKDLEIGMQYATHDRALKGELAYGADNGEGELLFRCLRSEMQALFRNAVYNLSPMERLVITFTCSKFVLYKDIWIELKSAGAKASGIPLSARLHIAASLPDPELTLCDPATLPIRVYGEQQGSLAEGSLLDRLGDVARCIRSFTSWYLREDERQVRRVKRKEHYQLDFETSTVRGLNHDSRFW